MTCNFFSLPGSDHLHMNSENEDRLAVAVHDGVTAAVLCDGAGSARYGAAAAETTAQTLSGLLAREFSKLFEADGAGLRLRIIDTLEQALLRQSQHLGAPAEEFACTILAAAMDGQGRCICLHLGDGILLQQFPGQLRPTVVSPPMTGLAPHTTYLTMNCDLSRYLRFYRWQDRNLSSLLLLTDGASEHLSRLQGSLGWSYTGPVPLDLPAMRTHLIRQHPRDDHSALLLTRQI